jgi:hypothetical protein
MLTWCCAVLCAAQAKSVVNSKYEVLRALEVEVSFRGWV